MPASTVSIPNTLYNAMFKWFCTMFSLGAPAWLEGTIFKLENNCKENMEFNLLIKTIEKNINSGKC